MTFEEKAIEQVLILLNSVMRSESVNGEAIEAKQIPCVEDSFRFLQSSNWKKQTIGLLTIRCHFESGNSESSITRPDCLRTYVEIASSSRPDVVRHAALRLIATLVRSGIDVHGLAIIDDILGNEGENAHVRNAAEKISRYLAEQGR